MTSKKQGTNYRVKVAILSTLWLEHRDNRALESVFEYGDLAFPLAFALHNQMFMSTSQVKLLIEHTFEMVLEELGMDDAGFDDDDLFFVVALL